MSQHPDEIGLQVLSFGATSIKGDSRKQNEDAVLTLDSAGLYAVADGTGGVSASSLAVDFLQNHQNALTGYADKVTAANQDTESRLSMTSSLEQAFNEIALRIYEANKDTVETVATTLVTTMVVHRFAYVAHVGNSRAYLWRQGELRCITTDHTLAMSQLRAGILTVEEYEKSPFRKALTQVLGSTSEVSVDVAEVRLDIGDRLLLCSDGLSHTVAESVIEEGLACDDAQEAVDTLCETAKGIGLRDDLSMVLLHIGPCQEATDGKKGQIASELGKFFFLKGLSEQQHFVVAPYFAEHVFQAGEVICRHGDIGTACYLVHKGRVTVSLDELVLRELGTGEHFGELALARRGERTATVRALVDTHVFILTRNRFNELSRKLPQLGVLMMLPMLERMGDRLDDLSNRLGQVDKSLRGKV
jgi:serine/threonine protein phosphatase PrpC